MTIKTHYKILDADSFLSHIRNKNLIKENDHVLIAVSGGLDSMVLLHLMAQAAKKFNLTISAAHFNHHLRNQSDSDQEFVKIVCKDWNIPIHFKDLNPNKMDRGESVENWARTERYSALEEIREKIKADKIMTAHHENDQIETLLMHISNGCGLHGLRGIRQKRGNILRPLLQYSRLDLQKYAELWSVPFCEDKTNEDITIPRNFIRHRVVKDWEENTPSIGTGFSRSVDHVEEIIQSLDFLIGKTVKSLVMKESSDRIRISIEKLNEYPDYVRAMVLKNTTEDQNTSWRKYQWDNVKLFLNSSSIGQTFPLGNGWICLRDREDWILERNPMSGVEETTVEEGNKTDIGEFTFQWDYVSFPIETTSNPMVEIIDGSFVKNKTIKIRSWTSGDSFVPLGMTGRKKVHNFLVDEKVDLFSKNRQLVVSADDEIIWVCGRRISEFVKMTDKSTKFICLMLEKKNTGTKG